jgi:hypothetical protein
MSALRSALAIALLLCASRAAHAELGRIVLHRSPAMLLMVTTPPGTSARLESGAWFEALRKSFEGRLGLVVRSAEQAGIGLDNLRGCDERTRFSCWTEQVRTDYQRARYVLSDGRVLSFSDHQAQLDRSDNQIIAWVLMVGLQPEAGASERIQALALRTTSALRILHSEPRAPGWERAVENQIFDVATRTYSGVVQDPSPPEIERSARVIVDALEADGWLLAEDGGYGSLRLESARRGSTLALDGVPIGTADAEVVRIEGIRPGRHRLELIDPAHAGRPLALDLELEARGERQVAFPKQELEEPEKERPLLSKLGTFGGAGVGVIGAGLVGFALLKGSSFVSYRPCPSVSCGAPERAPFLSTADLGSDAGYRPSGGILIAPLGYSLLLAGATAAIGTQLLDDEGPGWLPLVLGLALGGASYAISAAAR